MWLIVCDEDAYDPIHTSMTPMKTWRPILQMLVFFDRGAAQGVERINLSMTKMRGLFDEPWQGKHYEEQWALLRKMVDSATPSGSASTRARSNGSAGRSAASSTKSWRRCCRRNTSTGSSRPSRWPRRWAATLTDDEIELYKHVVDVADALISETYSRKAIVPGATTLDDLVWCHSQRCVELGLELPFPPSFYRYRSDADAARFGADDPLLRPGDFVRCDVGIRYLRLITDHQQWAYILRPGETDAPEPMRRLMAQTQRLQEIFMGELREGLTGNEMLANILARAGREGIPNPKVYSHSIGLFLHEPGPLIGLPWEQSALRRPRRREAPRDTAFAMELSTGEIIPGYQPRTISDGPGRASHLHPRPLPPRSVGCNGGSTWCRTATGRRQGHLVEESASLARAMTLSEPYDQVESAEGGTIEFDGSTCGPYSRPVPRRQPRPLSCEVDSAA